MVDHICTGINIARPINYCTDTLVVGEDAQASAYYLLTDRTTGRQVVIQNGNATPDDDRIVLDVEGHLEPGHTYDITAIDGHSFDVFEGAGLTTPQRSVDGIVFVATKRFDGNGYLLSRATETLQALPAV